MRFSPAIMALVLAVASGSSLFAVDASLPCLPPLEELVAARLAAISPKHASDQKKIEEKLDHNDWIDKLVLERIGGVYSYGKGLVVNDIDQSTTGRSLTATDNRTESWAVTYTIPLSLFRQKLFADEDAKAELAVLLSQQRLERQKEGLDINSLHNDFLEARSNYLICPDDSCRMMHGYKMRKLAISLLLLADLSAPSNCPSWDCFPDKSNCTANASSVQVFMANVQGGYSDEAKANLDWCISDSGSPDCPDQYGDYSECLRSGNRSCLMRKAIELAKSGRCSEALSVSLVCQCHNLGAQQSIRAAGEALVCSYLKTK